MKSPSENQQIRDSSVVLRVKRGVLLSGQLKFKEDFSLGRADKAGVQFADEGVSSLHAQVFRKEMSWYLRDLGSTNGVWVDRKRIAQEIPLPTGRDVSLGRKGPVLVFGLEFETLPADEGPMGKTEIVERYFEGSTGGRVGDRTMLIRSAFKSVRRRSAAKYWVVIGISIVLLAAAAMTIMRYRARVEELQELHATAEQVFYATKSLELDLARLRTEVRKSNDEKFKESFRQKQQEEQDLQARYINFLQEIGISKDKLSPEDWIIYRVARVFGECDVSIPQEFVAKVKEYIGQWQKTRRLNRAIERAQRGNLPSLISSTLLAYDLPPQFFYLALQESNLDTLQCGPLTRSGIAKGMWQFVPKTAWKYGLKTGPLVDLRRSDPHDERQHLTKSTDAAARYLRDLYETEAQASGLLVMACYNWDETKIREMLSTMPENPRQRNFWALLARHTLPEETTNYVFYIVSAAVIGENPHLFGFDFDNPLQATPADSSSGVGKSADSKSTG
ncbi:MAG TPA: FHA domain-containing protein [Bacteroidota bacterium]|nr:FHA domain-containing protein [Bacteroidota bacterium]